MSEIEIARPRKLLSRLKKQREPEDVEAANAPSAAPEPSTEEGDAGTEVDARSETRSRASSRDSSTVRRGLNRGGHNDKDAATATRNAINHIAPEDLDNNQISLADVGKFMGYMFQDWADRGQSVRMKRSVPESGAAGTVRARHCKRLDEAVLTSNFYFYRLAQEKRLCSLKIPKPDTLSRQKCATLALRKKTKN